MRYSVLAVSAALLLTSAACVVRVDGTAPTPTPSPTPTAHAHPPLSDVAIIYIDHWGISEPDYRYLSHGLRLSDDDIGVVLFLASRSTWHWRRIAVQRRNGHNWKAITRMAGLTPLVYFVEIPRITSLGHPYQGLYHQYWRYHGQPQRIHLGDADCVAMVRLHMVHDRYGYDPIEYMAPGQSSRYHARLQELERKRRTGQLQTVPPAKPVTHRTLPDKDRRRHGKVHVGRRPSARPDQPTGDKRGTGRDAVAHGVGRSPATPEPPGRAVSRSARQPPGHGEKSRRAKAAAAARAEQKRGVEHKPNRATKQTHVERRAAPHTKGAARARLADKGPRRNPGAPGKSDPAQGNRRATAKKKDAGTRSHHDEAATVSVAPAKKRDHGHATTQARRQSNEEAARGRARGGISLANGDADEPEPVTRRGTAAAARSKSKGQARAEKRGGAAGDGDADSAMASETLKKDRDPAATAFPGHQRHADEDIAHGPDQGDTSFADADGGEPDPVRRGGGAAGRSRGKP